MSPEQREGRPATVQSDVFSMAVVLWELLAGRRLFQADQNAALVARVLEKLSPSARLVITLLEIEDRSVKEIAALTGWSVPLVKVRAFRARGEMRKIVAKITKDKYL